MQSTAATWQRLATLLLGEDVDQWVAERREPDARLSWRLIARQLNKATNGQVDVTGETIRLRYAAADPVEQAAG